MITKKILTGCESRGDAKSPYLTIYSWPETRLGKLALHVFHRSDADVLHDHPFNFWSLILWGGYNEVTPTGTRRIYPGMVLRRPAAWRHRIELVKLWCEECHTPGGDAYGPCPVCDGQGYLCEMPAVTLVWKSRRFREWGFFTPQGWQQWRDYFREKGC